MTPMLKLCKQTPVDRRLAGTTKCMIKDSRTDLDMTFSMPKKKMNKWLGSETMRSQNAHML